MGLMDKLLGGGIGAIADSADKIISRFKASPEEMGRQEIQNRRLDLEERRLEDAGDNRQVQVNLQEAKHESLFVAGWRPWVGWVCGIGLAFHLIVYPLVSWAMGIWAPGIPTPEPIDSTTLMTVLAPLLGIGQVLRTYEKAKGVARGRVKKVEQYEE